MIKSTKVEVFRSNMDVETKNFLIFLIESMLHRLINLDTISNDTIMQVIKNQITVLIVNQIYVFKC